MTYRPKFLRGPNCELSKIYGTPLKIFGHLLWPVDPVRDGAKQGSGSSIGKLC